MTSIGSRSLDELEATSLEPPYATDLVERVARARRKRIDTLTAADLRLLIGQKQGLSYLLPRAIGLLEQDPWLEADFYPGDLLSAVLRAHSARGGNDIDVERRARLLYERAAKMAAAAAQGIPAELLAQLEAALRPPSN